MKYHIHIVAAWLLACTALSAQHVTESVNNLQRRYSPLFGSTASTITLDFLKHYDLGGKDTSYLFVVSVSNRTAELQGYSVGASVFDLFSGVSMAGNYDIKKANGKATMGKDDFMALFECVNKVFKFAVTRAMRDGERHGALCTCGVGDVMFGGEQGGEGSAPSFYFKVGDDATFSMSQAEFTEIVGIMKGARNVWAVRP